MIDGIVCTVSLFNGGYTIFGGGGGNTSVYNPNQRMWVPATYQNAVKNSFRTRQEAENFIQSVQGPPLPVGTVHVPMY